MPYSKINDLPESVKKLPEEQQSMWMDVFNSAFKEYNGDDAKSHATAWTAIHKKYGRTHASHEATFEFAEDGRLTTTLAIHQPKNLNFTDEPNGDTVFHDVVLMAEGIWVDSYSRSKVRYTANQLASMKFEQRTVKMDHDIFGRLPITNEIGVVENEKYLMSPTPRWVGDVRIFPTANGKDTATLLKRRKINAISPEMFIHNPLKGEDGVIQGDGLTFMGEAAVREGACSLCKFNEGVTMVEPTIDEINAMLDYMAKNPGKMNKATMDKMYAAMDKANQKEYTKSMLKDLQSHPEMMDDEMKSMMKDMKTKNSALQSLKGDIITTTETGGATNPTIEALEAQLKKAVQDKSSDIATLSSQLAELTKQKSSRLATELEAAQTKIAELSSTNAELIKRVVDQEKAVQLKELQRQIDEVTRQPVTHTKSSQSYSERVELEPPMTLRDFE